MSRQPKALSALLLFVFSLWMERNSAFHSPTKAIGNHRSHLLLSNLPSNDVKTTIPDEEFIVSRRQALAKATAAVSFLAITQSSWADATDSDKNDDENVTRGNGFAFRFVPPPEMEPGAKPVKTHLYEINWKSKTTPKYTFGITIDPVRIQTLKEVGVFVLD